jgi:hypothetical protein
VASHWFFVAGCVLYAISLFAWGSLDLLQSIPAVFSASVPSSVRTRMLRRPQLDCACVALYKDPMSYSACQIGPKCILLDPVMGTSGELPCIPTVDRPVLGTTQTGERVVALGPQVDWLASLALRQDLTCLAWMHLLLLDLFQARSAPLLKPTGNSWSYWHA